MWRYLGSTQCPLIDLPPYFCRFLRFTLFGSRSLCIQQCSAAPVSRQSLPLKPEVGRLMHAAAVRAPLLPTTSGVLNHQSSRMIRTYPIQPNYIAQTWIIYTSSIVLVFPLDASHMTT